MSWAEMIRVGGVAPCSDPMDAARTSANSALNRGFFIRWHTKPEQTPNLTIPCLLFARFACSLTLVQEPQHQETTGNGERHPSWGDLLQRQANSKQTIRRMG